MESDLITGRVIRAAGFGAAGAALGLLPVGRLEGRGRAAFIGGPAVLVAGMGAVATRASANRPRAVAGMVVGGAGIALSQWLWVAGDRAAERWLSRHVSHPRIAIAAVNDIVTAALNTIDERSRASAEPASA
ncbi:hypothetical protein [Aeromicrobium piscarium]|uniref:Uncharacterized protein n=1 Tax=Aeromicrobium piscarium TaxID=2590901 RepID=A0A554SHD7_9ACTN|nr:hypothetical protein [Aeromicrobium piscarium]TSD65752.1 hypothetical protein FNM00_04865 [Aeromicrobium piscarium]